MTRVEVWVVRDLGPEAGRRALASGVLDAAEAARAGRYRHGPSRDGFAVTRVALRTVLGDLLGCAPRDVPLGTDEGGRPVVRTSDARPAVHVSVAHTDGCALVATRSDGEVGVDVEPLDRDVEPSLTDRVCSERERTMLADVPDAAWPSAFLRLWVRKEAVVKADGRGLRVALTAVDVLGPGPVALPGTGRTVSVVDLAVGDGHLAAVAAVGARPGVTVHAWPGG